MLAALPKALNPPDSTRNPYDVEILNQQTSTQDQLNAQITKYRDKLYAARDGHAGGEGTNDLEGLRVSRDLLQDEDADSKTVIVMTDGAGVEGTKDLVGKMEKEGTTVIGIGIGDGTEAVSEVYTHHYQDADFKNLTRRLVAILTRTLLGPS